MKEFDFKGFLAGVIKFITPFLTDEKIISGAAWLIRLALMRSLNGDPEKTGEVLRLAREYYKELGDLLDAIEADGIPAMLMNK